MKNVFIDGSAGTTGLRIYERLSERKDINLLILSEEKRKDIKAREEMLNSSDISFLCLPDPAAIEAVSLVKNENTAIIDTSTAHRTNPDWTYGFAELGKMREKIAKSKRIANPGCHASGFISLVAPLVENKIIKADASLTAFSITGYSGGGKKMIAEYEGEELPAFYDAPRQYGISQNHKHIPEMVKVCGLEKAPIFSPIVAPFYSGMEVSVPIFMSDARGNIKDICEIYKEYYKNSKIIYFRENADEGGFLSASALSGKDTMEISVNGNDERIILTSRFDNLGKGASGSAIQNMNILLGVDEITGLSI